MVMIVVLILILGFIVKWMVCFIVYDCYELESYYEDIVMKVFVCVCFCEWFVWYIVDSVSVGCNLYDWFWYYLCDSGWNYN